MSSSQPYSYKKWFGILANPDDTVEYLRKGRMPRNTDTGIVEDNPYPNTATPDSSNFRKNFKGKGSMLWMVQNPHRLKKNKVSGRPSVAQMQSPYPDVHDPDQAQRNAQQVSPVFNPITTVQDNKPAAEEIRQQAPVVSDAKSALKRDTTPLRYVSTPRPTGNAYLDKAFAREAEMRDEAAKNYNDMVRKGQAKINEYKRQGNKEAEIWERLRLNSRKNEVRNLAPQAMVEIQNEAGLGKDNPEARKNILEWQKRVYEEELQKAKEAAKPVKGLDSRLTQPSPPSALDKVNKIMKG